MRTLLLTSCNRIKQVILALTINSYIIKERFFVIIADASTPNLDDTESLEIHKHEPYNHIDEEGYCSDITLFHKYIQLLPNIIGYNVINVSPRLKKTEGDAFLITTGLSLASIIHNDNYCVKLSGVCVLKDDILSNLDKTLNEKEVLTYHRTQFGLGEYSTRVFGCKTNNISTILQNTEWDEWISEKGGDTEMRFANVLNKNIPDKILYTNKDEDFCLLDGGGVSKEIYRERITKHIIDNNIPTDNPIIQEFLNGKIW